MNEVSLRHIMTFGAGYLVALIFLDVFPEIGGAYQWVLLGILTVFIFDRFVTPSLDFLGNDEEHCSHHHHNDHNHAIIQPSAACSTIGCFILCTFFDGIAIKSAYQTSSVLGNKVLLGQIFHLIPEGLLAFGVTLAAGAKKKNAVASFGAVVVAFLLGFFGPTIVKGWQPVTLAFSAGILIYITFSQLLPISTGGKKGALITLAGSGSFYLLYFFKVI